MAALNSRSAAGASRSTSSATHFRYERRTAGCGPIADDRAFLTKRVLDLVEFALAVTECFKGFEIGLELFFFRACEFGFRLFDFIFEEIQDVVLGSKLLLGRTFSNAAEQSSIREVRLTHGRQALIRAPCRDVINDVVFEAFRDAQTKVRKDAAKVFRECAINGFTFNGF